MKTRGWLLHSGIFGFGQNTTPGPCRSLRRHLDDRLRGSCRIGFRPCVSHSAYFGLRPLTMSKNALWIFSVIGPREPRAELDAVELADRRHLGGGAGEEGLVADVDLVARDALFDQLQAEVVADREDGVARDAVQRAGRQVGRVDDARS